MWWWRAYQEAASAADRVALLTYVANLPSGRMVALASVEPQRRATVVRALDYAFNAHYAPSIPEGAWKHKQSSRTGRGAI